MTSNIVLVNLVAASVLLFGDVSSGCCDNGGGIDYSDWEHAEDAAADGSGLDAAAADVIEGSGDGSGEGSADGI